MNTSTEGTQITEEDATTFGSVLLTDLWQAARRRGKREEGDVRPCYLYCDEFQNFVSPSIARGLAEASGLGLHMTLAHQMPSQLTDQGELGRMILNAVLANAKNKICFQLSHPHDLETLCLVFFRQHVDLNRIKQEIYSTKVLAHQVKYFPSTSTSKSSTVTHGEQESRTTGCSASRGESRSHTEGVVDSFSRTEGFTESDSDGMTTGEIFNDDGERTGTIESQTSGSSTGRTSSTTETRTESSSDTRGTSKSRTRSRALTRGNSKSVAEGHTNGTTLSPMLYPILGKELSSRQFVPIAEQLFSYAQFLDGLPDRHCVVRLASADKAVSLVTRTIKAPVTTMRFAAGFTYRALTQLTFVAPLNDALARIAERERTFVSGLLGCASDEPTTARRVIPKVRQSRAAS